MYQNNKSDENSVNRRHFLKIAGITTLGMPFIGMGDFVAEGVSIILDRGNPIAGSAPARWAAKELEETLTARGIAVHTWDNLTKAAAGDLCIMVTSSESSMARQILKGLGTNIPTVSEGLGLVPVKSQGKQVLLACGHDERGLVYALLELADRVQNADRPLASLNIQKPIIERPANVVRSLTRLFVSDVEDKSWYNDREMWPIYLR